MGKESVPKLQKVLKISNLQVSFGISTKDGPNLHFAIDARLELSPYRDIKLDYNVCNGSSLSRIELVSPAIANIRVTR